MQRAVEIRAGHNRQVPFIPVPEALRQLNCEQSGLCIDTCKALQKFMESSMSSTAVDLICDEAERIDDCPGPKPRSFGKVACGARLR